MSTLIQDSIASSIQNTEPNTMKRMRALAKVRWVLATTDGKFVSVDNQARATLTNELSQATIYDGRDNEDLKCRFMETLLRVPLLVVLIDE